MDLQAGLSALTASAGICCPGSPTKAPRPRMWRASRRICATAANARRSWSSSARCATRSAPKRRSCSRRRLRCRSSCNASIPSRTWRTTPRCAPAEPVAPPRREPARWSRWLPIAAAVQGIAITGLLAALWSQSRETLTAPRFTTLTTQTAVARGPVIRVVFAGNIALDDMNRVLRSIDAQIIAGPSEAGVYTLGLAASAPAIRRRQGDRAAASGRPRHVRRARCRVRGPMNRLWLICVACGCSRDARPRATLPAEPLNDSDPTRFVVVTLRNDAVPSIPRAGSTVRGYESPSSYALAPATRASAKAVAIAHGLREVAAWPIGLLGIHCIVYQLPPGADRNAALERLRREARVESAQPYQSFATLTRDVGASTSDPYRPLQRNLDVMDVAGAHLWSRGEGVRVAIIDTGVDASHPDLAGRIVKQENFVDSSKATAHDRHGTAVAGVIAAVENNSQGIVGIAPAARLYAMRACWPEPRDDARAVCSTLTLAKALAAAIEARIDIVNLSLTGPTIHC